MDSAVRAVKSKLNPLEGRLEKLAGMDLPVTLTVLSGKTYATWSCKMAAGGAEGFEWKRALI